MAERRMFSKGIIMSDQFAQLSDKAQILYVWLNVVADDDGFVNNPQMIRRMCGAEQQELWDLVDRRYLIVFDSGVVVVAHWHAHNQIKKDRYKTTQYQKELAMLQVDANGVYVMRESAVPDRGHTEPQAVSGVEPVRNQNGSNLEPNRRQTVSIPEPQDRIDKDKIDKDRTDKDSKEKIRIDQDRQDKLTGQGVSGSSLSSGSSSDIFYNMILDAYQKLCPSLRPCTVPSEKAKRYIDEALRQHWRQSDYEKVFRKAQQTAFLKGGGSQGWVADFEWLVMPEHMKRLLDGFYDPKRAAPDAVPMGASGVLGPAERESLRRIIAE